MQRQFQIWPPKDPFRPRHSNTFSNLVTHKLLQTCHSKTLSNLVTYRFFQTLLLKAPFKSHHSKTVSNLVTPKSPLKSRHPKTLSNTSLFQISSLEDFRNLSPKHPKTLSNLVTQRPRETSPLKYSFKHRHQKTFSKSSAM